MIPMDTVKTRLVTQTVQAGVVPYKGVLRTLSRIVKEEGLGPIYRSLTPRLVSVVPMIGIQVCACACVVASSMDLILFSRSSLSTLEIPMMPYAALHRRFELCRRSVILDFKGWCPFGPLLCWHRLH